MIPMNGSSFGRTGGFVRTYPCRIDPEPPCRRSFAQTFDLNRAPDPQIVVHVLHPQPPRRTRHKGFQLPDFYSGATDRLGHFTEGFCPGAYT